LFTLDLNCRRQYFLAFISYEKVELLLARSVLWSSIGCFYFFFSVLRRVVNVE
jgi:hypothetical protein